MKVDLLKVIKYREMMNVGECGSLYIYEGFAVVKDTRQ